MTENNDNARCSSMAEITPDVMKRCVRHVGHFESHVWIEADYNAIDVGLLVKWDPAPIRRFEYRNVSETKTRSRVIDETVDLQEAIDRATKAKAALDDAPAYIRGCPVHGNAACPEEYMLRQNGTPWNQYETVWQESFRCGLRPPRPTSIVETQT